MNAVTRVEIADQVESLFGGAPVTRHDLLLHAAANGAREDVLVTLGRLEADTYRALPELWQELNDIAVES